MALVLKVSGFGPTFFEKKVGKNLFIRLRAIDILFVLNPLDPRKLKDADSVRCHPRGSNATEGSCAVYRLNLHKFSPIRVRIGGFEAPISSLHASVTADIESSKLRKIKSGI